MEVIYLLIPIAIIFVIIAIYVFSWAVKSDQFDDLEKQGMSVLFDNEVDPKRSKQKPTTCDTENNPPAKQNQSVVPEHAKNPPNNP